MELNASKRAVTGKATRRLRAQGRLPGVIYGQRSNATSIELDMHDFERVYARSGRTQLIDLVVESGRPHKVLVKEVQVSPRRNTFLHVDFHQVSLRERLQVDVPVHVTGAAEPVRAGEADVLQVLQSIRVECVPTKIPEMVEADISGLAEVDAAVRVSDLPLPEGVSAVNDPDDVVVKLAARRVVEEEVAEPEEEPEAAEGAEEETEAAGEES
jgi:large subunit ribosomal protein L25